MIYSAQIWFDHVVIGKKGLWYKFIFESDEELEIVIEMLRARAERYKQNYPDMNKVHELSHIHLSELVPGRLDKDGGFVNPENKFLYVGV